MNQSKLELFERENPELSEFFKANSGKRLYYYANAGNGGDCLIAAATYQLLKAYKIEIEISFEPQRLNSETVLLAGGGNLVPLYGGMGKVIKQLAGRGNRIIVLPHSIRGLDELLVNLEPTAILFCRELETYEYVKQSGTPATAYLSHDLALYLDLDLLRDSVDASAAQVEFDRLLSENKIDRTNFVGKNVSCMRHGVEKTVIPKGPNFDISVVFQTGTVPGKAELGAWMMLEFCRLAAEITTNRLHIGIASVLVGTKTIMMDNSYGKVSSIYKHSVVGRFTDVEFVGEERKMWGAES